MNFRPAIYSYLTAGINTGENLQLRRNIIISVSLCSLALLLEVLVIAQILLGFVALDQLPKVLVSTLGVLIPLYLLLVKKNAALGIAFLVASTLILELSMLAIYFDDDPYSHVMWAQVLTFFGVLLLGIKRSLVPITIYSVVLVVLVYLRVDDSAGSHWRTVEFHQFVTLQILILGFAFISEWTVDRMLQILLQTQQQERDSAQTHALFMDNMLNQKKTVTGRYCP